MLDVFFISMDEVNAEENWQRLQELRPNAKRVKNVKGIYEVHRTCAKLSATENFYVVDADAWVSEQFDFDWQPNPEVLHWNLPESDCVLIWRSHNPVNGLEYGYGGIKLFPRKPFLEDRSWHIDLSTTIGSATVIKNQISCETRFNATAQSAWIGGFRECAKLASLAAVTGRIERQQQEMHRQFETLENYIAQQDWTKEQKSAYRRAKKAIISDAYKDEINIYNYFDQIENSQQRLKIWTTIGWHAFNGKYSVLGAQAGARFGLRNANNADTMKKINDWFWLAGEFRNVSV